MQIYVILANNFIKFVSDTLHQSLGHMNIKVQHNDYTSLFNGTLTNFLFTNVP